MEATDVPMTTATMPTEKFGRMVEIQAAATKYVKAIEAYNSVAALLRICGDEAQEAEKQLRNLVLGKDDDDAEALGVRTGDGNGERNT